MVWFAIYLLCDKALSNHFKGLSGEILQRAERKGFAQCRQQDMSWIQPNLRWQYCTIAILVHSDYGNTGCRVFKWGIQNLKDFHLKMNIPKRNSWILRIGVVASCQKLGIIIVIMWFKKWCYQKMSITKIAPELFFNEKKIPMIFDI